MPNFTDLPAELRLSVAEQLDTPTLLNFRLASTEAAAVGLSALAKRSTTLCITPSPASVKVFNTITQYPELCKTIQSIAYVGDDVLGFQHRASDKVGYNASSLTKAVATGLVRFPKLRELRYYSGVDYKGPKSALNHQPQLRSKNGHFDWAGMQNVFELADHSSKAGRELKVSLVDIYLPRVMTSPCMVADPSTKQSILCAGLEQLTSLDLSYYGWAKPWEYDNSIDVWSKALRGAKNLIDLRLADTGGASSYGDLIKALFWTVTLPRLQRLAVERVQMQQEPYNGEGFEQAMDTYHPHYVVQFFARHSETLSQVHFRNVLPGYVHRTAPLDQVVESMLLYYRDCFAAAPKLEAAAVLVDCYENIVVHPGCYSSLRRFQQGVELFADKVEVRRVEETDTMRTNIRCYYDFGPWLLGGANVSVD